MRRDYMYKAMITLREIIFWKEKRNKNVNACLKIRICVNCDILHIIFVMVVSEPYEITGHRNIR